MCALNKLDNIRTQASDAHIEFIHIYIDEAHPTDGWFIGGNVKINKHKTLQERVDASQIVSRNVSERVYCDSMNNNCKIFFGVQYERLYVVHNHIIIYQGGQGPMDYSLDDVAIFIQTENKRHQ